MDLSFFAPARPDGWDRILAFLRATCLPGDLGAEGGLVVFDGDRFQAHPEPAALFAITDNLGLLVLGDGTCAMIEENHLLRNDVADVVRTISAPDPIAYLTACSVRETQYTNVWPGGIVTRMATANAPRPGPRRAGKKAMQRELMHHLGAWSDSLKDPFHLYLFGFQGWLDKDVAAIETLLGEAMTVTGMQGTTFLMSSIWDGENHPRLYDDGYNPIHGPEGDAIVSFLKAMLPDVCFVGYTPSHIDGPQTRDSSFGRQDVEIAQGWAAPITSAHQRLALRHAVLERHADRPDMMRALEALPMA